MRNRKGIIGVMALMAIASVFYGEGVFAENGWEIDLDNGFHTSQTTASASISIGSGTVVGTLDAANAVTNPDEAGKVLSQTATIEVGNTDGYTVAVSGSADLTGRDNSSHVLKAVSGSKTLGSMSDEWGYYAVLGDTEASFVPSNTFKAMSSSTQTVGTGTATISTVTKKVTLFYGARVTDATPEDYYGGNVTVSVVAQPRTVTTTVTKFGGIATMQEMTPEICAAAEVNDTAYLRDARDDKYYWVTKMLGSTATAKDGECWMSQNLDLDLSTSTALTSTDSDVTSSWTPPRATTTSLTTGSATNAETYSWDLGQYVINAPTKTDSCGDSKTGLESCSMFTDVTGWTASDNPNFYKDNGGSSVDADTETYDAHYLVGNYYQWNAATAGTGASTANLAIAAGSICPKGWKLPSSVGAFSGISGSFQYLLSQYGVQSSLEATSSINGDTYNIALSPLFLVRGGLVFPGQSAPFWSAGSCGYYWSSRAHSTASYAYYLYFSTSVDSASASYRYNGRSLRCLIPMS